MTAYVTVKDPENNQSAKVSRFGQLIVAPIDYSDTVEKTLDVINTAFNFITPRQGQNIVITDIIVSGRKSVSASTPAQVDIYRSSTVNGVTLENKIVSLPAARAGTVALTGLNIFTTRALFINAKTDGTDVDLTLGYYYIPTENI